MRMHQGRPLCLRLLQQLDFPLTTTNSSASKPNKNKDVGAAMRHILLMIIISLTGCKTSNQRNTNYGPDLAAGRWCNVCKKSFNTWGEVDRHKYFHHQRPPRDRLEEGRLLFNKTSQP